MESNLLRNAVLVPSCPAPRELTCNTCISRTPGPPCYFGFVHRNPPTPLDHSLGSRSKTGNAFHMHTQEPGTLLPPILAGNPPFHSESPSNSSSSLRDHQLLSTDSTTWYQLSTKSIWACNFTEKKASQHQPTHELFETINS